MAEAADARELEELGPEFAVMGPDDTLVLRCRQAMTADLVERVRDQIQYVMQGRQGRVLLVDHNFDVLIQRGTVEDADGD